MRVSRVTRPLALALLASTVVAASGCSWFRKGPRGDYALSPQERPLEVPPDLNVPSTAGAMQIPAAAAQPAASDSAPAGLGFNIGNGSRDEVFARLGAALGEVEGVNIASRAQLLGTYDVAFEGADFLVRVSAAGSGAYVSAVDPRGVPATGAAPTKLMALLREALGGN
ncbi:MAG: hypothetical protein ABW178_06455 [Pseudoxanthomonas sp.]